MTDSVVFSIVSQATLDSADSSPLEAQAASLPVAPGAGASSVRRGLFGFNGRSFRRLC
jgi:hypothetical protein